MENDGRDWRGYRLNDLRWIEWGKYRRGDFEERRKRNRYIVRGGVRERRKGSEYYWEFFKGSRGWEW